MKRTIHLFLLILLLTMPCLAQEVRPWEVFAGYSFQRADVREYYKTTPIIYTFRQHYVNLNGWEAAVTENVNHWFGGTLELSGYYKTPQFLGVSNSERMYTILYGPRFSYRNPYGTAFVHADPHPPRFGPGAGRPPSADVLRTCRRTPRPPEASRPETRS